jgi:predicted small metal-binding protein
MLSASCKDAGFDCDYVAKGITQEELLKDVAQHVIKVHRMQESDMTPEMIQKVKSITHTS